MRTIANEFAGIIPLELFTYANYPQNEAGAMKYNVHNSILAGHGFWGNLQLMTSEERKWVNKQVEHSKSILHSIVKTKPQVIGEVGDSPEIYTIVNAESATGQVIAFSENPVQKEHSIEVNTDRLLGVLNHPYSAENFQLKLPFNFQEKESSAAAYILKNPFNYLGNKSIIASDVSIDEIDAEKYKLTYHLKEPGEQKIRWAKRLGKPEVKCSGKMKYNIEENKKEYFITIQTTKKNSEITLEK